MVTDGFVTEGIEDIELPFKVGYERYLLLHSHAHRALEFAGVANSNQRSEFIGVKLYI